MPTTSPLGDKRLLDVSAVMAGQMLSQAGFSQVGASVLDPFFRTPVVTGGTTYNQASGALNIVASVNANSEFLARSAGWYHEGIRLRYGLITSQRIANNNLAIMLADRVGEGLTFNCVSATQVNVVIPAHGWNAQMVGQSVNIGGIVGAAGVPGRYAIASIVDVNTVQFTVAGWPASGTGTCSVFGRNYIRNLVTGVTATNINFDAQRNGWATGDTVATVNTTASPGTIGMMEVSGREVYFSDSLRASTGLPAFVNRASRYENIPDDNIPLFVWVWSFNGSTAPASATTWTMSHLSVEMFGLTPVHVSLRANGALNPISVNSAQAGIPVYTTSSGAYRNSYNLNSAATTNANLIIGAAGVGLTNIGLSNNGATAAFVKFYDKATAPVPGTDVPVAVIPVPATSFVSVSLNDSGLRSLIGWGIAITGAIADADTTAVAAGQVKVAITRTV